MKIEAIAFESTIRWERAIESESTMAGERAICHESTTEPERATGFESTNILERATPKRAHHGGQTGRRGIRARAGGSIPPSETGAAYVSDL